MPDRNRAPMHIMPMFHHDIAYLKTEAVYTARCIEIIDEGMEILKNNPEYTFMIEQAWLLEQYWAARPEKREDMRTYAAQGRLTLVPALYAVPDMCIPSGESMFMHAIVGKKITQDLLGIDSRVCFIADCWGHHAQLPQIFKQCGYDYYAFSRCMRYDVDMENFIWAGVDGSRIKVHWLSTHYAGIIFPTAQTIENAAELNWAQAGKESVLKLHADNAAHCGSDPQFVPSGGDMMYPSALAPQMVKELAGLPGMPEMFFSTPERALDAVAWETKPTFGGEFVSLMQGSYTTNIKIKQRNAKYTNLIYSLEALAAATRKDMDFTMAWKLVLKQQFHDIICGTVCDEALADIDMDYAAADIELSRIAAELSADAPPAYFNSLPFPRCERVTIGGKEHIVRLPSLGLERLAQAELPEEKPAQLPLDFNNPWYTAHISSEGYIVSLMESSSGRELVTDATSNGNSVPFGGLFMQIDNGDSWNNFEYPSNAPGGGYHHNPADPYDRSTLPDHRNIGPFKPTITGARIVASDTDGMKIEQTGTIRYWVTVINFVTTITLRFTSPRIDYHTEFTNTSTRLRVRAAFPTRILGGRIRHQIPYCLLPRDETEQAVQMFVDYNDDECGLALLNRGLPSNNVDDGIMMLTLLRSVAMEYKTQSARSYGKGESFEFDYAIIPHGVKQDRLLWQEALSFNTPPVLTTLPNEFDQFSVSGALISAMRPNGGGVFMRIFECIGEDAAAAIRVPQEYTHYYLTDGLMRRVGQAVEINQNIANIPLTPWQIQGIQFL